MTQREGSIIAVATICLVFVLCSLSFAAEVSVSPVEVGVLNVEVQDGGESAGLTNLFNKALFEAVTKDTYFRLSSKNEEIRRLADSSMLYGDLFDKQSLFQFGKNFGIRGLIYVRLFHWQNHYIISARYLDCSFGNTSLPFRVELQSTNEISMQMEKLARLIEKRIRHQKTSSRIVTPQKPRGYFHQVDDPLKIILDLGSSDGVTQDHIYDIVFSKNLSPELPEGIVGKYTIEQVFPTHSVGKITYFFPEKYPDLSLLEKTVGIARSRMFYWNLGFSGVLNFNYLESWTYFMTTLNFVFGFEWYLFENFYLGMDANIGYCFNNHLAFGAKSKIGFVVFGNVNTTDRLSLELSCIPFLLQSLDYYPNIYNFKNYNRMNSLEIGLKWGFSESYFITGLRVGLVSTYENLESIGWPQLWGLIALSYGMRL